MPEPTKRIYSALISVYNKSGLDKIIELLHLSGVKLYSTGGTYDFLVEKGIAARKVEDLTSYPSILGGRVKTLHPKVFGGILGRRDNPADMKEMTKYEIPAFDLVIVDLYPFEDTVKSGASHADIVEKIDIGGISLIRAAAKNYNHVMVVPSRQHYKFLENILTNSEGVTTLEQRMQMAAESFKVSSHYDEQIGRYLADGGAKIPADAISLRYGENPHQKATFEGDLAKVFEQLHGKELSFNNLVDVDACLALTEEFDDNTFTIIKHTNPCGLASDENAENAWHKALAGDPVSAFGGIIAANMPIDEATAAEMDKIFFEVCVAPHYSKGALELLMKKKNRIILKLKNWDRPRRLQRTVLNGTLIQDADLQTESKSDLKVVTEKAPGRNEVNDLIFANKIVKHAKSNAIVLVKDKQLIGIGVGQTSRVDALKQAVDKATRFGFDLNGAVMASDAFFPFPDCVEIAWKAGIRAVIQPGGSVRDQESVDYCNMNGMAMVMTGYRHFKH